MRTTKRFTPKVLERFRRQGRGSGKLTSYIPWHRVSRGDPASRGRSHLFMWIRRQVELLSDGERTLLLFCSMLSNVFDIREQFPLTLESNVHELSAYFPGSLNKKFPGTTDISNRLGCKHPQTNGDGQSDRWLLTTDLLLTLKGQNGKPELLAIAFKPKSDIVDKRKKILLEVEKNYWRDREVPWLLITPNQYDKKVSAFMDKIWQWALGEPVPKGDIDQAVSIFNATYGHSLTYILNCLENHFGSMDHAQRAFWQSVWSGRIPIDLSRGWRPHIPPRLLSPEAFLAQNPISSRRSAWN